MRRHLCTNSDKQMAVAYFEEQNKYVGHCRNQVLYNQLMVLFLPLLNSI